VANAGLRRGFVMLPRTVLLAKGLSRDAKLLYAVLLAYAWQAGSCFPGADRLQEDLGCSINSVTKYLHELRLVGLLTIQRRGQGKTNVYTLHDPPAAAPEREHQRAGPGGLPAKAETPPTNGTAPGGATTNGQIHKLCESRTPRVGGPAQIHTICESGIPDLVNPEPQNLRLEEDSRESDSKEQQQQQRSSRLERSPAAPPPAAPLPAPQGAVGTGNGNRPATAGAVVVAPADLIARLLGQGVTERVATWLVDNRGEAIVRAQLEYAAYRAWKRNPAGALVQAIKENWAPPPGWVEAKAHAAVAARRADEEQARREAEAASRQHQASLPPEDRVQGRLEFWVLGQRRKGREPAAAEIAAKQAHLIEQLLEGDAVVPPPARSGARGAETVGASPDRRDLRAAD
jgi:hypothetical protein